MNNFLDFLKDSAKAVYVFITHRILWLFIVAAVAFYVMFSQLFELQIVLHDTFRRAPAKTKSITVSIPPLRGTIYDAKGRPLAINKLSNVVKIDPSVAIKNEALYELVKIFERNGETYADEFPMTKEEPYAFTYPDNDWREWYEFRWKDDMAIKDEKLEIYPETATAPESFAFLRDERFNLDEELPGLPNSEIRKILNFRCMLYQKRLIDLDNYDPSPITLATGVSEKTVAAIEENNAIFPGVYIDIETLREYPEEKYFSHILGYIRAVDETEYEANKDNGYTMTDLIGKTGLERSMESYLRGTSGSQTFEVNTAGRRMGTASEITEAQPGDKIFLTVDAYLQKKAYHIIEDALAQAIVNKMNLNRREEDHITLNQVFTSFIASNNLPINKILEADQSSDSYKLREYVLDRFPEANASERESIDQIKGIINEGIDAGRIHPADILLALIETGILTDPDGAVAARLTSNPNNAQAVTIEKILSKELSPQMINLDPSSGSVVIVDTKNNDVLAAVGYPSYDNNRFVNIWDNEYITGLLNDPTTPMVNRPFREPRAPGSTMKMVTAAAALETGVITDTTRIYDYTTFTKASDPPTNCWNPSSHGSINVRQALQVSCNYFFCEAAFRLGNHTNSKTEEGINILNDYLEFFGFNDRTGVEIGEHYDDYDGTGLTNKMSSPEFKKYTTLLYDEFTPQSELEWYDGDTVRTSMGQAFSNYTPAMMARYISMIANRGVRYPLHLVQTIEDADGGIVMEYEATPDTLDLTVSDKTWDTIIEGMKLVTERTSTHSGTGYNDFLNFPVKIAGKTGTAQQSTVRNDHSSFASFAPLDDPQIAIYVSVPFGDTQAYSHVSARIAKELIGEALGLNNDAEEAEPVNTLRK